MPKGTREDGIKIALSRVVFDSAVEYADNIPSWDGAHIEGVTIDNYHHVFLGVPNDEYHRAVSAMMAMSIYARAKYPGIKLDYMPILTGEGHIGKSTFIKNCCPFPDWFTDSLNQFTNKDAAIALQGALVGEVPEVDKLDYKERQAMKSMISRQVDRYRPLFEKHIKDHPRRIVMYGTSNETNVLIDTTNRKTPPLRTNDALSRLRNDKDLPRIFPKLMEEAKHRFEELAKTVPLDSILTIPDRLHNIAREIEKDSMEVDVWEGLIANFLDVKVPINYADLDVPAMQNHFNIIANADADAIYFGLVERDTVCALEIWQVCLGNGYSSNLGRKDSMRINSILKSFGWGACRIRSGKFKNQRGFQRSTK